MFKSIMMNIYDLVLDKLCILRCRLFNEDYSNISFEKKIKPDNVIDLNAYKLAKSIRESF